MSGFLFVVCQRGAEPALKNEIARKYRHFHFAYSRPGFVTFRIPEDVARDRKFELNCVFARTWGYSLGKVTGSDPNQLADDIWKDLRERYPIDVLTTFRHLHVWQRDDEVPGNNDFEPGISPLADEIAAVLMQRRPDLGQVWPLAVNEDAQLEDRVIDCVLVEPGEWWFGWHRAKSLETCWPGGVPDLEVPENMVSRTYLKMAESLQWCDLPIKAGDACVEIGSSPGGSCQALLLKRCAVTGIDPAEMDPIVAGHAKFTHIRARAKTLKRRLFSRFKWLMIDASVAPNYTLDTVEAIVTHPSVTISGLILTLKLTQWEFAENIPLYNKRIREWGYSKVRTRQLAYNRQEICIVATDFKRPKTAPIIDADDADESEDAQPTAPKAASKAATPKTASPKAAARKTATRKTADRKPAAPPAGAAKPKSRSSEEQSPAPRRQRPPRP